MSAVMRLVAAGLALAALSAGALADTLRVATYNAELGRRGPGLLFEDIRSGEDQVRAVVEVIAHAAPDVLLLTAFDWDAENRALAAFQRRLAAAGHPMPHFYAPQGNAGVPSGQDLNGNGVLGEPQDSLGYGRFTGERAMVLLSRVPIDKAGARDFTDFLWKDLPNNALIADFPSEEVAAMRPLASTSFWDVAVLPPGADPMHLLALYAGPPTFDGAEDLNGRRNRDEVGFFRAYLDGRLPQAAPDAPVILIGDTNLDPMDGEGRRAAMDGLLFHPRLQDPAPRSDGGAASGDASHAGDPGLDTVMFDGPGGLRVDYVLPDAALEVTGSGVLWPRKGAALSRAVEAASRHRLVWVDIAY